MVSGLVNGTGYRFDVAAINGVGVGPVSVKSDVVIPVGPPAVPTGVAAVAGPGAGEATVSWVAPTDVGGSPLTGFDVQKLNTTARGSEWVSAGSVGDTATSFVATGLTTSASWAFRVRAVNAVGDGAVGAGAGCGLRPPDGAGCGDRCFRRWLVTSRLRCRGRRRVPMMVGRRSRSSLCGCSRVTRMLSSPRRMWTAGASRVVVFGLTNGTGYRFDVAANNVLGAGPVSAKSDVVTPVGPPAVPTGVAAVAGPGAVRRRCRGSRRRMWAGRR